MSAALEAALSTWLEAEEIAGRRAGIRDALLHGSPHIRKPQFTRFSAEDVEALFDLYDLEFFGCGLRGSLAGRPLRFRISKRATKRGGSMAARGTGDGQWFEITVSSTLLFASFGDGRREIRMSGQPCADRLDALQRILEHEIVHLAETLRWGRSSCSQARFHGIAACLFGHTEHTHALVTPRERAMEAGIVVGQAVSFVVDGRRLRGVVNRVTKRATVLVPDAGGRSFSDGRKYGVYYVPIALLRVEGAQA